LTSTESQYEAHNGVYTGLNQAYWIKVIDKTPAGLLISNPPISGQKKTIRQVEHIVERNLVHPFIRGRDIQKWYISDEFGWTIIPHTEDGRPINEHEMKLKYPEAYEYFKNFEAQLKKRTIKPFLGRGPKTPFYRLDNIGPYTFDKYKVVWKPIAGAITGKATSFASAVLGPSGDVIYVPDHSVMFVSFKTEQESCYVNSILNSSIFLFAVASSTYEISGYGHVIRYVNIPEFDPTKSVHKKLAEMSKKAHEIALEIYRDGKKELKSELKRVEEEIDRLVAQLYDITDEELKEIRKCLEILKGEEFEEEFVEEISSEIKVDFLNAVARPNVAGGFEVAITNPLKDTVRIELQLPDRKAELETDKEQENIKVKVPPLPVGEHRIPYKIITKAKVAKGEFTLHVKEKKRFRKDESLTSKLDELLGDEA